MLAGVLLVAVVAGFLVSRDSEGDAATTGTAARPPRAVPRTRSSRVVARSTSPRTLAGGIVLDDLGLRLTVGADLARQGLVGMPGADPTRRSTSIVFATKALSDEDSACIADGARGWLGTLTRYDGPSAAMRDHAGHTIATLDYPGFHTTYRAVTQSCAARAPGATAADLAGEKQASSELWNAIRTAQPIRR